jgi:dihydroorotase
MDAAVAGGITSLACPPDTDPPLDEPGLVDMLRRRALALKRARVYPVGALTMKLEGRQLTEMAELAEAGCVAFSQANATVADTQVLWRALQYAATFGFPVWLRAEDLWLARGGVAHDGEVATRLGLAGIPAFAETVALATLLELVRATGARVHVCRISSAAGVAMLRRARHDGLPLTCDVGVHHVHLSDRDLGYFDAQCRLEPPLRSPRDRDALGAGLADGTIDCIVSDHTPVDEDGKHLPFAEAEPGATGLELLLPLALKWGVQAKLDLAQTLARVTIAPARILGVDAGRIAPGAPADLVLFDPQAPFRVSAQALKSQGKNTPFLGHELAGRVRATLVAGRVVYEA